MFDFSLYCHQYWEHLQDCHPSTMLPLVAFCNWTFLSFCCYWQLTWVMVSIAFELYRSFWPECCYSCDLSLNYLKDSFVRSASVWSYAFYFGKNLTDTDSLRDSLKHSNWSFVACWETFRPRFHLLEIVRVFLNVCKLGFQSLVVNWLDLN